MPDAPGYLVGAWLTHTSTGGLNVKRMGSGGSCQSDGVTLQIWQNSSDNHHYGSNDLCSIPPKGINCVQPNGQGTLWVDCTGFNPPKGINCVQPLFCPHMGIDANSRASASQRINLIGSRAKGFNNGKWMSSMRLADGLELVS